GGYGIAEESSGSTGGSLDFRSFFGHTLFEANGGGHDERAGPYREAGHPDDSRGGGSRRTAAVTEGAAAPTSPRRRVGSASTAQHSRTQGSRTDDATASHSDDECVRAQLS